MKRLVVALAFAILLSILLSPIPSQLKIIGAILLLFVIGMVLAHLGMQGSLGIVLFKTDIYKHLKLNHTYKDILEDFVRSTLLLSFGIFYILMFLKHPRKLRIFIFYIILALGIGGLSFSALASFLGGVPNFIAIGVLTLLGHATITLVSLIANSALIIYIFLSGGTPAPGATVLLPGITLPFVEGLFAIIILAISHELGHAVLSFMKRIKMHSAGVLFFGIIPIGAFIEPDEKGIKQLSKPDYVDILAAGSAVNYFLSVFFAILFFIYSIIDVPYQPLLTFLYYSLFLNYIIATVNCLPLFITDGARIFNLYLPIIEKPLNIITLLALVVNFLPNFL